MAIVGDEDAALSADLQAIRPAFIFDRERPLSVRRDLEDAAEGNIDDVQITVSVEGRAFDEAIGRMARPVSVGPLGADTLAAQLIGHRREDLGLDQPRRRFQIEHFLDDLLFLAGVPYRTSQSASIGSAP